jgi:hypothetical protein
VSPFGKTRAAAEYAARHGRTELTLTRAAVLLEQLAACQAALAGGEGEQPLAVAGLLAALVRAVRDLVGPAWLDANAGDPDVAAFTAMLDAALPPEPEQIDQLCSEVLWARFGPAGTGPGEAGPADAGPAGTGPADAGRPYWD